MTFVSLNHPALSGHAGAHEVARSRSNHFAGIPVTGPARRQVNAMGLLPLGPRAAFPKTLLQPWLVATPNQLILGDRRFETQTAQKDLFLERWVATHALLGGKTSVFGDAVSPGSMSCHFLSQSVNLRGRYLLHEIFDDVPVIVL